MQISGHQTLDRNALDYTHKLILNTKHIDDVVDLLNHIEWDGYRPGDDF